MESFEWDIDKDIANQEKHGLSFVYAQQAFLDPCRVVIRDITHSDTEVRYFCMGRVDNRIITVRFTWRDGVIRIFGAGAWRKGRRIYEQTNLHR